MLSEGLTTLFTDTQITIAAFILFLITFGLIAIRVYRNVSPEYCRQMSQLPFEQDVHHEQSK